MNPTVSPLNGFVKVALRKEGVDRNLLLDQRGNLALVALRKEGVDRNHHYEWVWQVPMVALRKEGVDRNPTVRNPGSEQLCVALRKEGVDRNCQYLRFHTDCAGRRPPQGGRG